MELFSSNNSIRESSVQDNKMEGAWNLLYFQVW